MPIISTVTVGLCGVSQLIIPRGMWTSAHPACSLIYLGQILSRKSGYSEELLAGGVFFGILRRGYSIWKRMVSG